MFLDTYTCVCILWQCILVLLHPSQFKDGVLLYTHSTAAYTVSDI